MICQTTKKNWQPFVTKRNRTECPIPKLCVPKMCIRDSGYIGKDGVARLNVLDVQKQIRSMPKPVIAAVNGFAIGGGHVLHVVCDLTIASENAIFGQTGPRVGSFDAGFGSSYLARIVGQKKAREIWFLCRKYNAQEALDMGPVSYTHLQYRMHEDIMRFSSRWFYQDELQAAPEVKYRGILAYDTPVVWFDTADCDFEEDQLSESRCV